MNAIIPRRLNGGGPPAYGARTRKRIATPFHAFPGPFPKGSGPETIEKTLWGDWEDHSPPKLPKGF